MALLVKNQYSYYQIAHKPRLKEEKQSQLVFTKGWIRPSKLRLPDNTAAIVKSLSLIASSIGANKGPELPIHVVQP